MHSKYHFRFIFTLLFLNLFYSISLAEEQNADKGSGIGIYIDQDLLVPFTNEDRDYTMGIAIEFFWAKEKGLYPLDGLVETAGEWLGIKKSHNDIVYSFMLGSLAYTPDDLSDPKPIYDDRPYSSLIYLSNKRVRADEKNALAAEVLIGLLGTNISRDAQSAFHRFYRHVAGTKEPVEPRGWSNQISDGTEFTMRVRLTNSRLLYSSPGSFDISSTTGLSLGFQTNANFGLAFRLGDIKSRFWSLPFDPVTRGNFLPSKPKSEWYFWTAARAHLVGYDALLQGQFKPSAVRYSADEIERLVYDGAVGLTLGFDESQFSFSANAKTSDLKNTTRLQVWGSINYLLHF